MKSTQICTWNFEHKLPRTLVCVLAMFNDPLPWYVELQTRKQKDYTEIWRYRCNATLRSPLRLPRPSVERVSKKTTSVGRLPQKFITSVTSKNTCRCRRIFLHSRCTKQRTTKEGALDDKRTVAQHESRATTKEVVPVAVSTTVQRRRSFSFRTARRCPSPRAIQH